MKRSQWIMFSLLFVLTGGIYLQLMNNKKEKSKDNKEEKRYKEERSLADEPEIYNNYFEGDKIVNIKSKEDFNRIIDWR